MEEVPVTTAPPPVASKKGARHHRHHHWDRAWIWLLLFAIGALIFAWIIAAVSTHWRRSLVPIEEEHLLTHSPNATTAFVFRLAPKRRDCKTGETWSGELGMCTPTVHVPLAMDSSLMDGRTSLCGSFFGNMCGKWNAEHTNEDRTFSYAYHRNRKILHDLIVNDTGPVGQFYGSCVALNQYSSQHESRLETLHMLGTVVDSVRTYGDLPVAIGRLAQHGYTGGLFTFSIERHPLEDRMVPFIAPDIFVNLTVPALMSFYESVRDSVTNYNTPYLLDRVRRVNKVASALEAKVTDRLEDITDFEAYIKGRFRTDFLSFGALPTWHTIWANPLGWDEYFQALDGTGLRLSKEQDVWIIGKEYLRWLMVQGIPAMEINDWRAYLEFVILYNTHEFAPVLPDNVYFKRWDLHGPLAKGSHTYHKLKRIPQQQVNCVEITQHMLPGLVAEAYLRVAMPEKEQIRDMTRKIVRTYKDMIANRTTWLSGEAKVKALQKLDNLLIRVAEPDDWLPEPFGDRLASDRYGHNMNMVRRYRVERNLQLWHKDQPTRLDRSALAFFAAPLMEVNAYYSGPTNTITILAGILQHPFFMKEFNAVSKYAILGSVIGHELGHVFDANGLHWDEDGAFKPDGIWLKQDMDEFTKQTQCVIREYGLRDKPQCNNITDYGLATLNEDMADLIGLRLSFDTLLREHNIPLSDQQKFFMVFSQAWCSSFDMAHTCEAIASDVHAIAEYRVDRTLRNMPEFARAFQCKGDAVMVGTPPCKVYG